MIVRRTKTFTRWFESLRDRKAVKSILRRISAIEESDSFGDYKYIGDKIYELRVHYGPGYRLYYTIKGSTLVLLLVGGDKSDQQKDIEKAKALIMELE